MKLAKIMIAAVMCAALTVSAAVGAILTGREIEIYHRGHPEEVTALIEGGADVNAKDQSGRTPLWFAAFNRNEKVAELLLKAGADVKGAPLWLQLDIALRRGNEKETLFITGIDHAVQRICRSLRRWWTLR